jgi:hypothetical protein
MGATIIIFRMVVAGQADACAQSLARPGSLAVLLHHGLLK